MFNIGAGEMIVIALILLMAVGPEQLPGLIRRVGRTVSEVKGMTEGLRAEFMSGLEEIERATDPEAWAAGNEPSKVKPRSDQATTAPAADVANGEAEDQVAADNAESNDNAESTEQAEQDPAEEEPEQGPVAQETAAETPDAVFGETAPPLDTAAAAKNVDEWVGERSEDAAEAVAGVDDEQTDPEREAEPGETT